MIRLTAAVGSYPSTAALLNGKISSVEVELDLTHNESNIVAAFRKMIRNGAYDVCEMGATTYLSGLEHNIGMVALPVFPLRSFPFGAIMVNLRHGIGDPRQLEGKRIAARTHTVTAVVWVRAMLQELYGVDLSCITWVINDREHVEQFEWPDNVEYVDGADLSDMLERGEVTAGIGVYRGHADHVVPLFPDVGLVEREWYARTAVLPIQHLVVVRRELLDEHPSLARSIYELFDDSKDQFLARLAAGEQLDPAASVLADRRQIVGPDPVPNGIEANRSAIESMIRHSTEQGILRRPWKVGEIFAPGFDARR